MYTTIQLYITFYLLKYESKLENNEISKDKFCHFKPWNKNQLNDLSIQFYGACIYKATVYIFWLGSRTRICINVFQRQTFRFSWYFIKKLKLKIQAYYLMCINRDMLCLSWCSTWAYLFQIQLKLKQKKKSHRVPFIEAIMNHVEILQFTKTRVL